MLAGGTVALDDLSREFDSGACVVLLGPSGSGEPPACRILAGRAEASAGRVEVGGGGITGLPPPELGISIVLPTYAL